MGLFQFQLTRPNLSWPTPKENGVAVVMSGLEVALSPTQHSWVLGTQAALPVSDLLNFTFSLAPHQLRLSPLLPSWVRRTPGSLNFTLSRHQDPELHHRLSRGKLWLA